MSHATTAPDSTRPDAHGDAHHYPAASCAG